MNIVPANSPVLWSVAAPVTDVVEQVLPHVERMRQLMKQHHGVGLAAPQCGIPLRFFIYGGRKMGGSFGVIPFDVVINPVITWRSEDHRQAHEGCLSFPNRVVPVGRPESIRVSYWTLTSTTRTDDKLLSGYLARVFQHEIDHLDGKCIFERPVLPPVPEEDVEENLARIGQLVTS